MKKRYLLAIATLIILSTSLFFLMHFSKVSTLYPQDGYFISGTTVEDVLLSSRKVFSTKKVSMHSLSSSDVFYQNMNSLYVGKKKKVEVNSTYPIFSNSSFAIVNLDREARLINSEFTYFDGYPNFTLTGGKLYNYGDLEQADNENYIFLELSNGTFINLYPIVIQTFTKKYTIPVHSILSFGDDYCKFFSPKEGELVYDIIDGIDASNVFVMGSFSFTYDELLIGTLQKGSERHDDSGKEEDNQKEKQEQQEQKDKEKFDSISSSANWKYQKPTVTVTDFLPSVYSAKARLTITDSSSVILSGIRFQVYVGDKVFLRRIYLNSGDIEISGLVPNTSFRIVGSYQYYNEEGKKMEVTFSTQTIKTLDTTNLEPVELAFDNGDIYSNKLQIDNLRIVSSLKKDSVKGISSVRVLVNDDSYSLSSSFVSSLLAGKSVTYTTPGRLLSNREVKYQFLLLDAYGNQIQVKNASSTSRTSKEIPSVTFQVVKNEVNSTTLGVTLKNNDGVLIQNYRYFVYDSYGKSIVSGDLDKSKDYQVISLKGLDPNSMYQVQFLADFDSENGKGVITNSLIGEGKFSTLPLSSFGSVKISADLVDLTSNSVSLQSALDIDGMSSLLLELLSSLTIIVRDEESNIVFTKVYSADELIDIKAGVMFVNEIDNLQSMSNYTVSYEAMITQGSVSESATVVTDVDKFKTYKEHASVQIKNKFVSGNMIDFDVSVVDMDGSIESDRVLLEVRDNLGKLVTMESLAVNDDYKRIIYEKLDLSTSYVFTYKAEEYNVGYDNSSFCNDYVLFEETIVTEEGITGSIELLHLVRQVQSGNLFNLSDYNRIRKEGSTGFKEYDLKNRTVTFGGTGGYVNFSYFVPEAMGQKITVSFYAKYAKGGSNKAKVYLSKGAYDSKDYVLSGLSQSEWKQYVFTFDSVSSYVGFLIDEAASMTSKTYVSFKDIQIQIGKVDTSKYTEYSELNEYLGSVNINLLDQKDELAVKEYYVRIYKAGKLLEAIPYSFSGKEVKDVVQSYNFQKNKNYELYLSVKIRDRFYDVSSVSFSTNSEIRAIRTISEFVHMHPSGKYIVLNDLDFTASSEYYNSIFYGDLDFLGHSIISNVANRSANLMYQIGVGGSVRNLVMDYNIDNKVARSYFYGLAYNNYGTIDNLMIRVLSSTNQANTSFTLGVWNNYGTIKNFVVNSKAYVSAKSVSGILVWSNRGTLQNGYLYGENMQSFYTMDNGRRKDVAPLAGETNSNSKIENVFSLISVNKNSSLASDVSVGNLIGYSNGGSLKNVYSVEKADNTNLLDRDPNIGTVSSVNAQNVFYASDKSYHSNYSTKISKLSLYDINFQESVLNTNHGFDVSSYVSLGYYPQVIMNSCMPSQDFIALPTITDADMIDVTSVEEISNDGDSAKVAFYINNPSAEKITKIGIQDINTVEILSQENERGKTKVIAKISNPLRYVSKYYIRSITSVGALGYSYDTTFGQYERSMDVSLYRLIYSISDWEQMNQIPNQNYMLKADLDFSGSSISKYVISNFSGKLDGAMHVIKNIRIVNQVAMFQNLTGTIQNLYIENYTKTSSSAYGGFVYKSSDNALIDNVHMKKVAVAAKSYLGGLVGYATSTTIKNSSVTDFKNVTEGSLMDVCIGGMVGYLNDSYIQNSYVSDVTIHIDDAQSTNGIGGMVGRSNGGAIDSVYVTGSIYSNSLYVGGIVGNLNSSVSKAWSHVDITTEHDYVGGISGLVGDVSVSNTLVLGSIYSSYSGNYIHRTNGNTLLVVQNNYAWSGQPFYGYVTGESASELLLSTEQLRESNTYIDLLNFGESFDISQVSSQVLPKLRHSDTKELLPGQVDNVFADSQFNVSSIDVDATVTGATISVELENPSGLEITGIDFDYLTVEKVQKLYTQDGITVVEVLVSPKRYYDSYTLSKVFYRDSSGAEKVYQKCVKVNLQFYKTLASYEDWQQVSKTTLENYRLAADIDFSGKTNVNTGVSMARLDGQDKGYALKNLTLDKVDASFALIQKLTTSLSNVTFSNITIHSAASGNYLNLIQLNYANISNVTFSNITIEAAKISYVAPIGLHRGNEFTNVTIAGNRITGSSYVGGLIASSNQMASSNITADDCHVTGSGIYIGGVIGYKAYSDVVMNTNYIATDMEVIGQGYVGGVFGYGSANGSAIYTSSVVATEGRNYVGGFSGQAGQAVTTSVEVWNCTVLAHGNSYVGGAFGTAYELADVYVHESSITQEGSLYSYVGGVVGTQNTTYQRIGITSSQVNSSGTATGGLVGMIQYGNLYYAYLYDVSVTGVNRVGGVVGYLNGNGRIAHVVANTKVIGSDNYVGGVVGSFADSSSYRPSVYDVIVANSSVVGNNYVGGFTGYTKDRLDASYFYQILLVTNVNSTLQSANVGIINGTDKTVDDYYGFIYVYDKSKLNDIYIPDFVDYSVVIPDNFVDASMLRRENFYTDRGYLTYWDFNSLTYEYYPKIKGGNGVVLSNQSNLLLPVEALVSRLRSMRSLAIHKIPSYDIYSSGVSTLNIEFDEVDGDSYFEIYQDGKKVITQDILERTYTFSYNYKSDLKIVVGDGKNYKTKVYSADDFVNLVSVFKDRYAYIYNGKLMGNIVSTSDSYIHLYGDRALTNDLKVYDLSAGGFISESNTFDVALIGSSVPLYKFTYENTKIDTYYRYSVVHKKDGDVFYDKQFMIKDGVIEVLDSSLSYRRGNVILDNYAHKNYVSVLGEDGVVYHLKDEFLVPDEFSNKGIRYMSNTLKTDHSIVVVMYETGRVIVFDYRTGKVLAKEVATEDVSILSYFKENLSYRKMLFPSDLSREYNESLNLISSLKDTPIQSTGDGDYHLVSDSFKKDNPNLVQELRQQNYVTYYNPVRESYDILNIAEVITTDSTDTSLITENDKIYTSYDLVEFYMQESIIVAILGNVNVLVVFALILILIVMALLLWIRNLKLLRISEEKYEKK